MCIVNWLAIGVIPKSCGAIALRMEGNVEDV